MPKLPSFFIFGIVLVFTVFLFLDFIKIDRPNLLAVIQNAFRELVNPSYSPEVQVTIPKTHLEISKPEEKEEAEVLISESPDENSVSATGSTLDEIMEKIDEISEKVDILSQEVGKLISQELEENETLEEEAIEEIEEKLEQLEEETIEEVNTPAENIILCEKGSQIPFRDKTVFNEIGWMGTHSDWRNEWLELKNISGNDIPLKNWQILDKEQEIKIVFGENDKVSASQLFLLERTNDDSLPSIAADKVYSGNLNDENETLYLFDENCQLQDEVLANPSWPAGDKIERRTMERSVDFSWHTYTGSGENGIFGTPKAENSQPITSGGPSGSVPSLGEAQLKILITEVKISEKTGDKDIFVELYNLNNYEIDLTNWYLQRKTGEGVEFSSFASKTLFSGKKIAANSYFLLVRQGSNFENLADLIFEETLTENNVLALKNPDREVVDKVGWGQAQDFETAPAENPSLDSSLGRKWLEETNEYQDTDNNQQDFEIQVPSPKAKNQSPAIPEPILEDDVPPEVNFDLISPLQTNLIFSISWVGQDLAQENVTPSGIAGFSLKYNIISTDSSHIPSDIDGIAIQYEDINNEWQDWEIGQVLELEENQNLINLSGEDGRAYKFEIQAKDVAENESSWTETTIEINTHPIVINEVYYDVGKDKGKEGDNEWLEVYNLTNSTIDISGWIIEDNGGVSRQKVITGPAEILGKSLAVITSFESTWLYWTIPDKIVKIALDNKIGSYGLNNEGDRVILKEPTGKEIDAMSYGDDISVFELPIGTKEGESLSRKTAGYDTDTADDWQVSANPSPGQ